MQNSQNKNDNSLKPHDVISRGHPNYLLMMTLGIFIVFSILSAVYLYFDIYRPLTTHYSALVSILADIHETLIFKTLKINAIFFLLILLGILVLGILYTHRICGPLHKVKLCSRSVAEGKIDTKINFRKKDAINILGEIFNEMTRNYSDRISKLGSELDGLKETLARLESLAKEGKATESEMNKIIKIDRRIRELFVDIKL